MQFVARKITPSTLPAPAGPRIQRGGRRKTSALFGESQMPPPAEYADMRTPPNVGMANMFSTSAR